MDQQTCAFLFRRWSDDYANVQRLERELATLRQQHDILQGKLHVIQLERERSTHPLPPQSTGHQSHTHDQLERRPEYVKLQEQLQSSTEKIQNLSKENNDLRLVLHRHKEQAANDAQSISDLDKQLQQLTLDKANLFQERDQLTQQCEELVHKYKDLQANATLLYDANVRLQKEAEKAAQQFESLQPEMERIATAADKYEEREAHQKASYEKEMHDLKQSLEVKETEIKGIRSELAMLRDTLLKTRESNKSLAKMVTKLQGRIVHKLGGTPSAPNDPSHPQQNAAQVHDRQPSTSTTSTLKPQTEKGEANTEGRKSEVMHPEVKVEGQEKPLIIPFPVPPEKPSDLTPMPAQRRQAFTHIPQILPTVTDAGEKGLFERDFLKNKIGGAIQALIVRVTASQTPLAKAREIASYLCPGLDHNPWCPNTPGEHGYMFVGLGREQDTFLEPQNFNVFVGQLKDKKGVKRKYRYIGVYRAIRVAPLAVEEWNTLSEAVKETYVSRTKEKTSDSRALTQIKAAYDKGELTVPCVKLECVAFDEILFTSLVSAASKPVEAAEDQPPSTKRRRVSNAASTQGSTRKRVTLIVS